jgi:hypothetical protein
MSKSKKLSRIELDVVVSEIFKRSNKIKENELKEKYCKEIEIVEKELDLFKERYNKFKEEFSNKINELRKLESKEFKLSVFSLNNLEGYKRGEYNYIRSGYCLMTNIDNSNNRNKIYNELVINRISEDINVKEVIDNYIKELVK